jgi:hypothetical protein
MGIIRQGILGGFSGRVGNVVGSSWKGIAYMKSLPLSVANPRTAGQVAQRTMFGSAAIIGSIMLAAIVKPLWDRFAQRMSGFNAFVKRNTNAYDAQGNFVPANFVQSNGNMLATKQDGSTVGATNIEIDFVTDITDRFQMPTDIPFASVLNANTGEVLAMGSEAGTTRADGSITIPWLQEKPAADTPILISLSFLRADGTIVSDSSSVQGVV